MSKSILVTGASGEIGTIVREDLSSTYDLTLVSRRTVDHPGYQKVDVCEDYEELKGVMAGKDAVLHLAYVEEDGATTANHIMAKNIYRAALETQPHPRVIIASSIHTVGGYLAKNSFVPDDCSLAPNGLYAAFKCYTETLGQFFATEGLEVVVIRFGGVRCDDRIVDESGYSTFWLSRRDCAQIISRAIDADLSTNYVRCFAVSDNEGRVHDLTNAKELLGYSPQDGSR